VFGGFTNSIRRQNANHTQPGICETTPGVKSYSGYVHLPPGLLNDGDGDAQEYPINTFFWFFEARKDPEHAPLAIWLNGGPGASSMMGLLGENGPCFVAEDSKSTYLNPWSWNNEVNMLYLDQPAQVGFSYDILTNCTYYPVPADEDNEQVKYEIVAADFSAGVPEVNLTHRIGTFSSQVKTQTSNSTKSAAHALWHFAQTWFFEFPYYKPVDNRISLWAESYGGHYGPGFFRFFQEQNDKIANGSSAEDGAQVLHLDTLGIVNGLIDMVVQGGSMIDFPNNNVSPPLPSLKSVTLLLPSRHADAEWGRLMAWPYSTSPRWSNSTRSGTARAGARRRSSTVRRPFAPGMSIRSSR